MHGMLKRETENRKGAPAFSRQSREKAEEVQPPQGTRGVPVNRRSLWISMALVLLIVAWAGLSLLAEGPGFAVIVSQKLQGGEEATSAMARLFAALILMLFSAGNEGWRLRWVAAGLVALGMGHLVFGYLEPLIQNDPPDPNEALYESLVTRILACTLFVMGLIPRTPTRRKLKTTIAALAAAPIAFYFVVFEVLHKEDWIPMLTHIESMEATVTYDTALGWLTPWYWIISSLPLALTLAVTVGAFRQSNRGLLPGWLLISIVLMSGSLFHEYLWPSAYDSAVLTTSGILRLMFAVVIVVGGIVELARVASERTALLATERERVRRLGELATLRADFSAMVAHELDGPLSAVRRLTEMLSAAGSDTEIRRYATTAMEHEIDTLNALIGDVRAAAAVERDDFEISIHPIPVRDLLFAARSYAMTLPGDHPVGVSLADTLMTEKVNADPERVGQVLRNLISNAAKYSPDGAPIELRARRSHDRVRIEVADRGPGIRSEDKVRIFEKFGRGRASNGSKVAGVGLGLYLSRRIAQAHGGDLALDSRPGGGSVFGLDLEVAS